jgi:hypothetical protein
MEDGIESDHMRPCGNLSPVEACQSVGAKTHEYEPQQPCRRPDVLFLEYIPIEKNSVLISRESLVA